MSRKANGGKQADTDSELQNEIKNRIQEAQTKFIQARFEDLAGNHVTAEFLRDQAEAIYAALDRMIKAAPEKRGGA